MSDSGNLLQSLNLTAGVDGAASALAVRQEIVESPDKLSRGKLQSDGAGNYHIGAADDPTARAMADLFTTNLDFGHVRGLPAVATQLSGFGPSLLSFNPSHPAPAPQALTPPET